MGKKKDERKRREREAEMAAAQGHSGDRHEGHEGHAHDAHKHDAHRHEGRKHEGRRHEGGAPFAGIAATIARQMGTPVGRQMIAAGLMAAATAISKHDAKSSARPTPPTPPAPPSPASSSAQAEPAASKVEPDVATESTKPHGKGPFAGETPEPPRSETNALPPEFAKVLDSVTVGLERLFVGFGKPTAKKDPPAA
ncbi:hypothetical protein C8J42_101312 [Sphingomonas sp. PP-CE-1A-559]|uniref:hypothetical protein n=1 Tax=Sphingomonas sp. PP-CE-1A-559 TaxID=2135657 RepID=UPI001055AE0E|nr:hypothetical protein [Sphingomonas sp. PP-CE-1A-559]TCP93860.1 hypothetical protein C8J42_101312 [Sphingomonas sp. PP-CE-1A-559]